MKKDLLELRIQSMGSSPLFYEEPVHAQVPHKKEEKSPLTGCGVPVNLFSSFFWLSKHYIDLRTASNLDFL